MKILTAAAALLLAVGAAAEGGKAGGASAKAKLAKAYQLAAQKKPAEAIAAFNAVLKADPQNHDAVIELGYLHASLKHWATAARYMKSASEQEPGNMRLRMDLGYVLQSIKDHKGAAAEFAAVAREPGEFQAQASAAQKAAEDAAGADRGRLLDEGYAALKRGDRKAARRSFEGAVERDPKDAAALKQLGFLSLEQGRLEEAAASFAAATEADPSDHFAALQLGYVYQRLKRTEEAREAFAAALDSVDPKIHEAAQAALKPAAGRAPAPGSPVSPVKTAASPSL